MAEYDYLVVGAGLYGSIFALEMTKRGKRFCGNHFGVLEYRSVRFETEVLDTPNDQGNVAVNYIEASVHTRIIEHKYFECGTQPKTVISREYSSEWKPGNEPYYPVNDEKNSALFAKSKALADAEARHLFGGRLADYKYCEMHQVIAACLCSPSVRVA